MTIRGAMLRRPEIADAWTHTAAIRRVELLGFRHNASRAARGDMKLKYVCLGNLAA